MADDDSTQASDDGTGNGFFSFIGDGISSLGNFASQVAPAVSATAPLWNNGTQSYQTNVPQPTFVGPTNTQPLTNTVAPASGIQVNNTVLIIGGIAALILIVVLMKD